MSKPRKIMPGKTLMLTRRCAQRRFLLNPSKAVSNLFIYCLAYAAKRFNIAVHAFILMSNHYHIIVTDRDAKLPDFMLWMNQFIAKALNAKYKLYENFWAPGSYHALELTSPADVMNKLLYLYANPVSARLVKEAANWPGLNSINFDFGQMLSAERPSFYFRENSKLPKEVKLKLTKPPAFKHLSRKELKGQLKEMLARREQEIFEEMKEKKQSFLGIKKILKNKPTDRPKKDKDEEHRSLVPRIAARDKEERLQAIAEFQAFYEDYRAALDRWRSGETDVEFPAGTYKMRVFAKVRCRQVEDFKAA